MNHHYTVWHRAKWLIPSCTEVQSTATVPPGLLTKQRGPGGQHHSSDSTVCIPGEETQGTTVPCSQDHTLKLCVLREILWRRGQKSGNLGLKNLASSIFWLGWKLLQLWSLVMSRNCKVCRIMASQKITQDPNSLQGKTIEYAQDSRAMQNKSS